MNIEYNNDLEDFVNFNLVHSRNSPVIKRQRMQNRLTISVGLTIILFIISLALNKGAAKLGELVLAIVFGVIFFLIFPWASGLGVRQRIENIIKEGKNEGGFGKQKVVITPEAITGENAAGEGKYFWSSLDKLVNSPDYVFLYVGTLKALIIPRNSFANEKQCAEFIELVEQYYSKATGKTLSRFEWK